MTRRTCSASRSESPRAAATRAASAMSCWVALLMSREISMRPGPSGPKNAGIPKPPCRKLSVTDSINVHGGSINSRGLRFVSTPSSRRSFSTTERSGRPTDRVRLDAHDHRSRAGTTLDVGTPRTFQTAIGLRCVIRLGVRRCPHLGHALPPLVAIPLPVIGCTQLVPSQVYRAGCGNVGLAGAGPPTTVAIQTPLEQSVSNVYVSEKSGSHWLAARLVPVLVAAKRLSE